MNVWRTILPVLKGAGAITASVFVITIFYQLCHHFEWLGGLLIFLTASWWVGSIFFTEHPLD